MSLNHDLSLRLVAEQHTSAICMLKDFHHGAHGDLRPNLRLRRSKMLAWAQRVFLSFSFWLARARGLHIHISINIYAHMHAYCYVYVIIYVIHDYICYVFMYIYIYIYIHMHIDKNTYIYIYIYTHIFAVMGHAWLVGKGLDSAVP